MLEKDKIRCPHCDCAFSLPGRPSKFAKTAELIRLQKVRGVGSQGLYYTHKEASLAFDVSVDHLKYALRTGRLHRRRGGHQGLYYLDLLEYFGFE